MRKKLGFDVHLIFNLARHSYATKMKLDGVPTSFFREALGHSNTSITEHYLNLCQMKI
jgi:integrase/recombinase XerD